MRIRGKLVLDLTADDLTALVDAKVPESRVLEYKAQLPGAKDEDKREFLADVSAMANTAGGVILYGVETERAVDGKDTGIPASVPGVDAVNLDAEILRLQNMLRDGVHPALTRVAFARIALADSTRVTVALGVSRALVLPHMIAFQRSGRVFRRSDVDKYQVDVHELRRMVLESEDWTAAADVFRRERVRAVRAQELVPNVWPVPAVMLHILPLGRLDALHDLRPVEHALMQALPPHAASSFDKRWNFDGLLYYGQVAPGPGQEQQCYSFVQWFRGGGIETYSADLFWNRPGGATTLDGSAVGKYVRNAVRKVSATLMEQLAVDPPFIVLLTLAGARGTYISAGDRFSAPARGPILQDFLYLPAVVFDDTTDAETALQPMLDVMWQAAGWSGAPPVGDAAR